MNPNNSNGQRPQGLPNSGPSSTPTPTPAAGAGAGAGTAAANVPPHRLSSFIPPQQRQSLPVSAPTRAPPAPAPAPAPAPLGSNSPAAAMLYPHGALPMPAYLGASSVSHSPLSTQLPSSSGAAVSLANSPFQRLNAQNHAPGGGNAALFPHLQWHTSRAPSDSPTVATAAVTAIPTATAATTATATATATAGSAPTVASSSRPAGVPRRSSPKETNGVEVPATVKREFEEKDPSEGTSRKERSSDASTSKAQPSGQAAAGPSPSSSKATAKTSDKEASARSSPSTSKASISTSKASGSSTGRVPYRPPCLPAYCKPTEAAGEQQDPMFPDTPVLNKPLLSYKGFWIVSSKAYRYKLSAFDPFEFADEDQSNAFWMPKSIVPSKVVKVWRDGREERLRVKNEWLAEAEAEKEKKKSKTDEKEKEVKMDDQEMREKEARAQKRKGSGSVASTSTSGESTMAPANKRQRLTEHESTSTSTPAQSGLPDDSVEVPIIETNNRAGPSSSSSSADLHQRRPRGRPPGTKNKPQEKPRGSLLRISTSAAVEDGPQEIDEEDELVDEDMDDTVDMSVMQPTASTTATTTTTAAAAATTTAAAAAAAAEATTAAKARQEEIEQEALIARVLQGGQGPIVNSSKVKTEAFLEIPATRSPRYPPVVQKVLTSATGDNGDDDDDDDDVIEIQRPSVLPLPDIVPSSKPVPSRRSLGKQRKIVEDEVMADSSDSRPSPAPTGGAAATSSKPTTRGRGAPASRVRAVTEAEFKGLLGPRTGSSLEPTPPPNSRALRSAQSRAGRDGSEGTPQVRERERDASSPVEEFLSQPQAIVSAEELARRAVPRVGGWIVPLAPPRAAPAAIPSGYTSRAAPGVLQIATSPHRRSSAHQVQQADKFAVVVPIRAGPPQGEFGREEQLADAYVQLRDRHADSATIRTPQDLANALQQSGVLQQQQQQQQQQGQGQAGPSVAPGASTPVQGSSAVRPVVAAPCLMAPPVVATQTPNGSIAAVQAPVVPGSSSAATRRTSTGPPVKSGAVADLEQRMMRSPAIPSFLKREIIQLLRTLTLQPDPKVAGAYAVNIDLARIPLLATKDCWWFDLDLGKVQEGGNGYTVILNLELAEQTLTTHGMSRALVKQVHTIPSISPWYDSFGRRRMDDGTLMPDANRVEGGVQTESLEDAQSIAVVEYQAELVKLKRELERTKTELEAESVAKQESEEQSAFRQQQYDQASTRAVELSREVTTLETQVSTLKRQLSDGLAAHRLFSNAASERYQADLRELQMENRLLRAQARNTDNEVRRRAAEYDTLRAMEVVRLREKEKVFRAQGGVGPYVPPPSAPVLSIAAAPRAAAAAPPTAAAAPSLALPLPLPPPSLQRELVRSPAGAISLARGASTPSGSKQAAHSPTPPSVAAGMAPPTNNGTLFLGPEMGSSSQLGGTQGNGMSMDISADDLDGVGFADLAPATQASHFL